MSQSPKGVIILIFVTFLFTLSALGFVSFHTKTHCWITSNDKTSTDCPTSFDQICSLRHAYAVHYSESSTGFTFKSKLYCPWRSRTAVVGLSALSISQFLLILALFTIRSNYLKNPLIITGLVVVSALLATLGLMIYDIIDGFHYNEEYKTSDSFRPATYLANASLVFVSTFLAGFVVYFTINSHSTSRRHPGRISSASMISQNQSYNANNTTTKHIGLNTSMSQVQYTAGESGILRDNPAYHLPSAGPLGRASQSRFTNKAFSNTSISQGQAGANSARTLLSQRNESSGKGFLQNAYAQSSARRDSSQNIPSQSSTRRDQVYVNKDQSSPRRSPAHITKGQPQSNLSMKSPVSQSIRGQSQSNSPGRRPIYLNMTENKPRIQQGRRNMSPSRNLASIDQVLPIVRSPGKSSVGAGSGRRRSGN